MKVLVNSSDISDGLLHIQKLYVSLSGSVTTNQLPCRAHYKDVSPITSPYTKDDSHEILTNNSTKVLLADSPASGWKREVSEIEVFNADTVNEIVTVWSYDGTNYYQVVAITLQPNYTLNYSNSTGWRVTDTNGNTVTFDMAATIHGATADATPNSASMIGFWDSVANALRSMTLANLATWLGTYFTAIGATLGGDLSGTLPNPTVVQATGAFAFKGDNLASPNTSTGTQNDVSITGLAIFGWNGGAASTIDGFAGGSQGRMFLAINLTTAYNLTFPNENTGSSAANRIRTPNQANFVLGPRQACWIYYDNTDSRWVVEGLSIYATALIGTTTVDEIIHNDDPLTVSAQAVTVGVSKQFHTITNNAALSFTITMATAGAVRNQIQVLTIYDYTNVVQSVTFVNGEASSIALPTGTNGSTTLPATWVFKFNDLTSKWRFMGYA